MRRSRLLILAGTALGLLLAAGAGAWMVGVSRVEARLEAARADADLRGWSVSYEIAGITGFPMAYRVALTDVALIRRDTGMLVRLPKLQLEWRGTAADKAMVELPENFQVDLPNSEVARLADPRLPPVFRFAGRTTDAALTLSLDAGIVTAIMGTADAVSISLDQQDYSTSFELALDMVTGRTTDDDKADLSAAALRIGATARPPESAETDFRLEAAPFEVRVTADAGAQQSLREVVYAGAAGAASLSYDFGTATGTLAVTKNPQGNDGAVEFSAAEGAGILLLSKGILDLDTDSRSARWTLARPEGAGTWGSISAARTSVSYVVPLVPTPTPAPGRLKFALEAVEGDKILWAALDPGTRLDRSPGNLVMDLGFTTRLMQRIDQLPPDAAPAYEVGNVMVNQAVVQALGAELSASGDIEMIQPMMIPDGTLSLRASGLSALLKELEATGLIDAGMHKTGDAILQVFATPAPGDDNWQSELTVGPQGISMNGMPIQ